ncbi:MAG: GNAT family N-acetyltransferase [Clostridia bacterium]|nr:GNAT family N-acetyltransferase [Clostridia bacterium]
MKLFDEIPYIETDELILRRISPEDAPFITEMNNNPMVRRYLPVFLAEYSFKNTEEAVSAMYGSIFENRESLFLGIYPKDTNEFAGIIEVYNYEPKHSKASIGSRLRQSCWGNGIARKATIAIIDYLFCETDILCITAHAISENLASNKILPSLGFTLREKEVLDDWGYKAIVNKYYLYKPGSGYVYIKD